MADGAGSEHLDSSGFLANRAPACPAARGGTPVAKAEAVFVRRLSPGRSYHSSEDRASVRGPVSSGRWTMMRQESAARELGKEAGRLLGHGIVALVGVVLIILGTAMGVSLVLLPIGIPVGFIGLALLLWGLFGWTRTEGNSQGP
jgi:hypothetical protein